jgi:hypothetical protein
LEHYLDHYDENKRVNWTWLSADGCVSEAALAMPTSRMPIPRASMIFISRSIMDGIPDRPAHLRGQTATTLAGPAILFAAAFFPFRDMLALWQ